MTFFVNFIVILVAFLHLGFLMLEMFLWEKPVGLRIFSQTRQQAAASKVLAANQGLYNGFLAAGLLWGVIEGSNDIKVFFLSCVVVAGIYGAVAASSRILYVQALPGIVGLVLIFFS